MSETPQETTETRYKVLVAEDVKADPVPGAPDSTSNEYWRELGSIAAKTSEAAIRQAVGQLPESKRGGRFVAVPVRSWNPVTVSEKVERTLVIGS